MKTEEMATRHIAIDEDADCYYLQCTICRHKQAGTKPLATKSFLSAIVAFTRKHQKCAADRDI